MSDKWRLNIPALSDLKMHQTGHRLPPGPADIGLFSYTEGPRLEQSLSLPFRSVYRMSFRVETQQTINEEASWTQMEFMEGHMRRELVRHLYGGILSTLTEARSMARVEGASSTYGLLDKAGRALDNLMRETTQ